MRKLILIATNLLLLSASAVFAEEYDGENEEPTPAYNSSLDFSTAEGAKVYMTNFYSRLNENTTVSVCSPFSQRQIGRYTYWIAKEFVTEHIAGNRDNQQVFGVVFDPENNWIRTLPVNQFRDFLATGSRRYLQEPDLDVND